MADPMVVLINSNVVHFTGKNRYIKTGTRLYWVVPKLLILMVLLVDILVY